MTTDVRTVKPSDNLPYASHLMHRKHIGALPVLEQDRLTGIISRSDLPEVSFARDFMARGRVVRANPVPALGRAKQGGDHQKALA